MRRSAVRDAAVAQPRPLFGDHRVSIGMNRYLATRCLDELVNLTRLDIYRLLVRARPAGLDICSIRSRFDIPVSTPAILLRGLINGGRVAQEKLDDSFMLRVRAPFGVDRKTPNRE